MKTFEEWRKEVHGLAVEKGWWGSPPNLSTTSVLAKLALVVSELSEAIEIVREPNFDPKAVWATFVEGVRVPYAELAAKSPSLPKPEGFGTEIADAVIRVLDLMGALDIEFVVKDDFLPKLQAKFKHSEVMDADAVLAAIMRAVMMLAKAGEVVDDHPPETWVAYQVDLFRGWVTSAVLAMCALSARMGVDVDARIAEKHTYNVTRANRHGGKRA